MSTPQAQPPEHNSVGAAGEAADSRLLIDQFLPTYDVGVVHAEVFRAAPAQCFLAASELDLFQAPLIQALIGIPEFVKVAEASGSYAAAVVASGS